MFRTIPALLRTLRSVLTPVSRVALVVLMWMNRHTIALWYRSIRDELTETGFDARRLRHLVRALWRVSNDRRTANAEALRSISVRSDGYEFEALEDWSGRVAVETLLAPIPPYPTETSVA